MRRRANRISESECLVQTHLDGHLHPDRDADAGIHMLEGGGLPLIFLVVVDNGVSKICYLGPGTSVALQIQCRVVGILPVMHLLAGFLLDGCHSALSWLVDQALACLVTCCLAMKNKVDSLSGTLVQLVVSWSDPEVEWLQYLQKCRL